MEILHAPFSACISELVEDLENVYVEPLPLIRRIVASRAR
jgi:hypothetical protein